ncbi:MAG TPA: wax ester/triacylglycerol synthase family O-acyltransferase [Burkholderiaceae bacterium]|nr:wax ester/triacylglycerol synthase family O-acyltransferase [Burkholderiaceae bacterium]
MKQLGAMDASFLYLETPETPMHVGGLSLFELPPGYAGDFYEDFKAHLARRLHLIPVFTKKIAALPFDFDHPVWIDDPDLDLDYHVRRLTLNKPGTTLQLEALVARLHSNLLDRSRPLWEFYVIDGLASGQVAVYSKGHHAALDGSAGVVITKALYDLTPTPREVPPPPARAAAGSKSRSLLGTALANLAYEPVRWVRAVPDVLKATRNVAFGGWPKLPPFIAPKTRLNGPVTAQRAWAMKSLPLAPFKQIAKQTGTSLNDVVMAICSGALRRYLLQKNELPGKSLTAAVPVSLREQGNCDLDNQVFAMLCNLATDVADPAARLRAIHQAAQNGKRLTGHIKDAVPRRFSFAGWPLLMQGALALYARSRLAGRLPPMFNVAISNVPGPQAPLYLAGAKLLTLYPVSLVNHGFGLNITVQSYNGTLDFGLTACRRLMPDVHAFGRMIEAASQELQVAVLGEAAARKAAAPIIVAPEVIAAVVVKKKTERASSSRAARGAAISTTRRKHAPTIADSAAAKRH